MKYIYIVSAGDFLYAFAKETDAQEFVLSKYQSEPCETYNSLLHIGHGFALWEAELLEDEYRRGLDGKIAKFPVEFMRKLKHRRIRFIF